MTTDADVERLLREAFQAARPAATPTTLRTRVREVPHDHPVEPAWRRLAGRLAVPVAAVSVAAAAVALGAFGLTREPITGLPPGTVGGSPIGFDPAVEGPGFVSGLIPSAVVLGVTLAIVGGALVAGTFFSPRVATARGRVLIVAGLALVATGVWFVRFDVGLTWGGVGGALLGYEDVPTGPLDEDPVTVYLETAAAGEPTVSVTSIRNTSALPIRIEGFQRPGEITDDVAGWKAIWIPADGPGFGAPGLRELVPFEPLTLQPGEALTVYFAGRAGRCAFGPDFDPGVEYSQDQFGGYAILGPEVTVAYSVLAIAATQQVDMQQRFAEPIRGGCDTVAGAPR